MRFAVRGAAVGLLEAVSLRLEHSGGTEVLSITEDGPFAFDTELADNASYVVELIGAPPCAIGGAAGVVEGASPSIELVCESVLLADLFASGPTAMPLELVPTRVAYSLDVSVLQQQVRVIATAATSQTTITVGGTPVTSGQPSAPIALNLGDNVIDIVVTNANDATRTYQLTVRRAAALAQYAYGKASNTGSNDLFGASVALWGDLLAVGAPFESSAATGIDGDQDDDTAFGSGAVYVFRRTGSSWAQEAYLKASNTEAGDEFGSSMALWEDILAVGAPGEDSNATGVNGDQSDDTAEGSGAVYVFRRAGNTWSPEAYVKASNTGASDEFGASVALWGDTFAAGAPGEDSIATGVGGDEDDDTAVDSGAVYVFRDADNIWAQEAYLKVSNTGAGDRFGASMALEGDVLAVGAPFEASAATDVNGSEDDDTAAESGAVYVLRRTGVAWAQEAYLKASNTGAGDRFGAGVALSGDTLAIGASTEDSMATGAGGNQDDDSASDSGALYVFHRASGAWAPGAYVKASNTGASDRLGGRVALSGDTLAAGALGEDSSATGINGDQDDDGTGGSGALYVFH